jgi:8-oxo-dGTP pyrophosphatase MutT (NUDIX family)
LNDIDAALGYDFARVAGIMARLVPAPWPWAEAHASMIAREWDAARQRNPHLFDGEVLLAHRIASPQAPQAPQAPDALLEIDFMPVRYSAFRAFKAAGFPDGFAVNAFPAIAPHDRQGRYLLGRMGDHTDNAGALYFATGTPDPGDVADDGSIDLTAAAIRELAEETGLAPDPGDLAPYWHVLRRGGHLALIRPWAMADPAPEVARACEAARRAMDDPELAGLRVLGPVDGCADPGLPDFMRAYLGRAFAGALRD